MTEKQGATAVAVIGGLVFLLGLVRFNSLESQLVRGFGGSDRLGLVLLIVGGVAAVSGAISAYHAPNTQAAAEEGTSKCPSCGRYNFREATNCVNCGQSLATLAASTPAGTSSEIIGSLKHSHNIIEEMERLAALKERGVLSDEEFQQQKGKLLG